MITLGIQLTKQNKHLIRKQRKTNYRKKIVTQSIIYGYHNTERQASKKRMKTTL